MTFYEMNAERGPRASGLLENISLRFRGTIRTMQYGRMMEAMSRLSDENLKTIGLDRAGIARHARECVYGDDA